MNKILIIEDEEKMACLMADYLHNADFDSHHIAHGLEVMLWLRHNTVDLIVLDLMLPGRDGLDLCQDIRRFSTVPIIIISARIEEVDRLLGLELGADDYLCKPFSPREMVARIKAVLRRFQMSTTKISANSVQLDAQSFRVSVGKLEVELTTVEFQLLKTLYQQPGRIFSRSQLMDLIYRDQHIVSNRTIDSHIKKLRKKLADVLPDHELIHSVYGAGYRYEPPG